VAGCTGQVKKDGGQAKIIAQAEIQESKKNKFLIDSGLK
jgi:hypothetical protein